MQGRRTWTRLPAVTVFVLFMHALFLWALIFTLRPVRVVMPENDVTLVEPFTPWREPVVRPQPQPVVKPKQTQAPTPTATLKVHVAPPLNTAPAPLPPSGLSPAAPALGAAPATAGNGSAFTMKGRSQLTQSLQFQDACATAQRDGKPIPVDCHTASLSQAKPLGPRPDVDFQAVVAKNDRMQRYKASPGSTDYWSRVNHTPSPRDHIDNDLPSYGAYSDPKAQKVFGGCLEAGSCTSDGTELRQAGKTNNGG